MGEKGEDGWVGGGGRVFTVMTECSERVKWEKTNIWLTRQRLHNTVKRQVLFLEQKRGGGQR